MTKHIALGLLAALLAVGCNESGRDIDRVQTNLVDKSIFEGEWWYGRTVVDVDADEAQLTMGLFQGEMGFDLGVDLHEYAAGSSSGYSLPIARIRWVIDEDYLFAYRAYELVQGGNSDADTEEFRGQPLAAFKIEAHVDVRREYNEVTGELLNVTVEDTSDRHWYERTFMRVDWSQNMITSFYDVSMLDLDGEGRTRESVPFFYQEDSQGPFPKAWEPQFVRVKDDPTYRFHDEWDGEPDDTVHYMSFVTQEVYSPGPTCLQYGTPCSTANVTARSAFLRVPPHHEYPVATQSHAEFDRFGVFRTYQRTYVRGGEDREDLHERCEEDSDCGTGGSCDVARHICVGGLTSDQGETDFLAFYRPRMNFWRDSLTDTECRADWECDGRHADTPGVGAGSVCDRAARRCTVPLAQRSLRQNSFRLSPGFPTHLVPAAFEVVGNWNEAFMRGWRAVQNRTLPTGPSVACQSVDPTAYCFCDSPEDSGGSCPFKYDPFVSPQQAADSGVEEPYNCYIEAPEGFSEPDHPTTYEEYRAPDVYGYTFKHDPSFGDSECMLVLESNSCDRAPGQPCEELGDIRYQFFNYVAHGNVQFGGVSIPLVDPTTGELISANANMAGTSIESVATTAQELFPVLRCANGCEPGEEDAEAEYFAGENLRGYFSRLGRTHHPVGVAPSGSDGYSTDDHTRPGYPAKLGDALRASMDRASARVDRLRGTEGRAQIMSDRLRKLEDTPVESRLLSSIGPDGRDAVHGLLDVSHIQPGTSALDDSIADRISPFRGGLRSTIMTEQERWRILGKLNVDPPFEQLYRERYWEYWAEAFRGRPKAEASIRIQQAFLRSVMHHEVGHSVGLRHNFGASFDRNNYFDGYYRIAEELPLPRIDDFDEPSHGGDGDGYVGAEEQGRFAAELRRVRNERAARGIGNTMSASTMDYNGDLSDLSGLGRYDVAATIWNYFDKRETFNGDARQRSDDSLDGITRSDRVSRSWWSYYRGGESCEVNTDCPYGPVPGTGRTSRGADCDVNDPDCVAAEGRGLGGQPIFQRCIRNPRYSTIPIPCQSGERACVCSTFDEDVVDYTEGVYPNDRNNDGKSDHTPVSYLFCSDDRTVDISWCNRGDAGESFQEAVDHYRRRWEERYPSTYYRRYRRYGAQGGASVESIIDVSKIYQHLFYRYYYEPEFRRNRGPLGFDDQYLASVDAMNWLTSIVHMPDTGSYALDEDENVYRRISEEVGDPAADFSLDVGQGFPMWSEYQDGFYGYFRTERAGVFFDKYMALLALSVRDWGFSYTLDERFYINFYDLFPVEMTEFFGGMILDDERWFAPRVNMNGSTPEITHMNWYRGTCTVGGQTQPCRGSQEETYTAPAIEGTSNEILRDWAAVLALATFPVFYDTTFEQRLSVFKLGSGDGFHLPARQPSGEPTCAYGSITLDDEHVTGCDDPDYIVFDSDRLHTQYVAVKVRTRIDYNLEEEQLGFQLLRRMVDTQEEIRDLRGSGTLDDEERARLSRLTNELQRNESFLEYLIDLQRRYGISSYL